MKKLGEFSEGFSCYLEKDYLRMGSYVSINPAAIETFIVELRNFAAIARDPVAGVVAAARKAAA